MFDVGWALGWLWGQHNCVVYNKSLVFERKVDTRGTPFVALSVRPHALLTKTTVAMLKQAIFTIKAEEGVILNF